jgi:hypothetical protein
MVMTGWFMIVLPTVYGDTALNTPILNPNNSG